MPLSDTTVAAREREVGAATAAKLRAMTGPYILRREKKEILGLAVESTETTVAGLSSDASLSEEFSSSVWEGPRPKAMGRKNDFIVWLKLAPMQRRAPTPIFLLQSLPSFASRQQNVTFPRATFSMEDFDLANDTRITSSSLLKCTS
jgi:hypothetical protein